MTDAHESTTDAANEGVQPTAEDAVTSPPQVPMDDAAAGPTGDADEEDRTADDEQGDAAENAGDFA